MIVVIEPFGAANTHLPLVKSLMTFLTSQTSSNILFVSNSDFFYSLPLEFRQKSEHVRIKRSNNLISRIFIVILLILRILYKYRGQGELRVFLLFSTSVSNFILKLLSPLFSSEKRFVYVFLHGDLQNVKLKGGIKRRIDGMIQLCTYFLDGLLKNSFRFVTISGFIGIELNRLHSKLFSNIISFDFPYLYDKKHHSRDHLKKNVLTISTVGVNSLEKNSHFYNYVANGLRGFILDGSICLKTSSRNDNVDFSSLIKQVELNGNYLLSWEDYSKNLLDSDLLLFFNDNNYNLVSSSSYFDCVNFRRPIVAIRNAQWEYNFTKFGEIGFLCSDVYEMIDLIERIAENKLILDQFDFNCCLEKTSVENSSSEMKVLFNLV
jgi:hypothetical protein